MNTIPVLLALLVAGGAFVQGVEFPLEYKKLSLSEAQACPGGYGMGGAIQKSLRSLVKSEPKPTSTGACYGTLFRPDGKRMVFRLDESKGDRHGFDQLIIDLNENGDLTDDPVIMAQGGQSRSIGPSYEQAFFGPMEAPAYHSVGPWRPVFYAQAFVYNRDQLYMNVPGNDYYGNLRCFSGWILETSVEVAGVKQKIAIKDGNCNFILGDQPKPSKIMRNPNDPGQWYLPVEDFVLRDRNQSGRFENDPIMAEAEGLSSVIYFGTKPFNLALSDDFKSVRIEPFTESTGQLKVNNEVTGLVLAHEIGPDKWEPVTPAVANGIGILPLGNYRLISAILSAKSALGETVAGQTDAVAEDTFKVDASQTTALKCGLPMELKVTCNKLTGPGRPEGGFMGAARSLFGGSSPVQTTMLNMTISIFGAGGEQYSRFYKNLTHLPNRLDSVAAPQFRILDAAGNTLAAGNFEFG
ncbi:MAG: hypothetical protein M1608_13320 [Candidatus Omnitrophica bacterium]|nr:hypothetical protein [Candidatus Omnitrophota bacterium]